MRLVRAFGWLYGGFALAFLAIGASAAVDGSTFAGLPGWAWIVLGAFDAAFSVAVLRRVRAVVPVLRFVHSTLAVLALCVTLFALRGLEDAEPWRAGAKFVVHAALAVFWWRSRGVAEWFGRSLRENGGRC